jgi:hypothetical protein
VRVSCSLSVCLSSDAVFPGQGISFEVRPLRDNLTDQLSAHPPMAWGLRIVIDGYAKTKEIRVSPKDTADVLAGCPRTIA